MDIIQTVIIIGGSASLSLVMLALYMRRTIPNLLGDVSDSIGEALTSIIKDPMSKRAMSILGQKSGDVRHNKAAENALATGILNNMAPEIQLILDRIAPNFIEEYGPDTALALAAKYGPLIQQFLPQLGLGGTLNKPKSNTKYGEF